MGLPPLEMLFKFQKGGMETLENVCYDIFDHLDGVGMESEIAGLDHVQPDLPIG
jgi:hypothetical protein